MILSLLIAYIKTIIPIFLVIVMIVIVINWRYIFVRHKVICIKSKRKICSVKRCPHYLPHYKAHGCKIRCNLPKARCVKFN